VYIDRFKPLADFDWQWTKQFDRAAIRELMNVDFLKTASNAIITGNLLPWKTDHCLEHRILSR